MGGAPANGGPQSWKVSGIYLFNIICGTGVLALPHTFAVAGLGLGTLFLLITAGLSYMVSTWLVEMLSVVTVLQQLQTGPGMARNVKFDSSWMEQSGAAAMYILPRWGQIMWFSVIVIYMFGDLAVYTVFLPSAIATVAPSVHVGSVDLDSSGVYYAALTLMAVIMTPFNFFTFNTTKWLQVFTTITRHLTFWVMIGVSLFRDATPADRSRDVAWVDFSAAPLLFGSATYSLICQHYIPQLSSVVKDKNNVTKMFVYVFGAIVAYYLVMCWTAVFAFAESLPLHCSPGVPCRLQPMVTFTFEYLEPGWISTGVVLLPLFAVATNFPLIGITLRDNIIILAKLLFASPRAGAGQGNYNSVPASVDDDSPASKLLTPRSRDKGSMAVCMESPFASRAARAQSFGTPTSRRSRLHSSGRARALSEGAGLAAMALLQDLHQQAVTDPAPRPGLPIRVCTGLVALVPPFVVAYITKNIDLVVRFSGAYGGAVIMFAMPVVFVYHARKAVRMATKRREDLAALFDRNPFASPFQHWLWYLLAVGWALLAVTINTYSFITG